MAADYAGLARSVLVSQGDADEGSVEVARVRPDGENVVVAARFRRSGLARRTMFSMRPCDDGWRLGAGTDSPMALERPAEPWQFGSFGLGSGRRVAGIWVTEPAARLVRVTDLHGRLLEDSIEEGVAILLYDEGAFADRDISLELIDGSGTVLGSGARSASG